MTQTPDEIIEHRACFCPECGKDLNNHPFEFFGKRQIIDIPTIKQVVTEHQVYRCKYTCGKVVESAFPIVVDSPVSYGSNIGSLVGYLNGRQYLPFKRLQEMLHDFLGTTISEGGLHCLLNRLASKGTDAYEMIRQSVLNSSVIGTDETGMKVNGKSIGSGRGKTIVLHLLLLLPIGELQQLINMFPAYRMTLSLHMIIGKRIFTPRWVDTNCVRLIWNAKPFTLRNCTK